MDEGRRAIAVDDVVGEEAPSGWRMEEGVGLHGFLRPPCTNGGRRAWEGEPWLRDLLV